MADRSQRLQDFLSEAQESVDLLGRDLLRLDGVGEPDPDLLNAVFRAAHTLKGLASMFGIERMARLAHALEDVLDDVRMGRRAADRATVDLLLEAPEVLSRIIAEEAAGEPPRTADAAARLSDRLRASKGGAARAAPALDPLDALELGPELRTVLTEYEEHRLRTCVEKGLGLFRVKVSFELGTFDRDLSALSARLKAVGEVVSTLPSSDAADAQAIAFELLFASKDRIEAVRRQAGTDARVEAVARRASASPGPAPSGAPAEEERPPRPGVSPAPEPHADDTASLRSASQSVRVDIAKLDRLMNVV